MATAPLLGTRGIQTCILNQVRRRIQCAASSVLRWPWGSGRSGCALVVFGQGFLVLVNGVCSHLGLHLQPIELNP